MARLPVPGSDDGTWGAVLNEYLSQAHSGDGSLKPGSVTSGHLADGSVTSAKLDSDLQATLSKADSALQTAPVTSVNAHTGDVMVSKSDVGLSAVDNTADSAKPVSTAQAAALDAKASVVVYGSGWAARPGAAYVTWIDPSGSAPTPADMQAGDILISRS